MAGTSPKTKAGTRKLSEVAKKLVQPSGITGTHWLKVRDICTNKLGLGFDPWQDGAGRLILATREDGKLACMIGGVGMSLPRQVGKTYLISAIVFGLCIMRPGTLVIWSAHHGKTHGETFLGMQEFCSRSRVAPYISQVYTGSGDEEVRFTNKSRILFGAREHGFGRGIPGVDVIVSDEAQIMSDKALDAQLATMNTSDFGLAIYVGTPPLPEDRSEAFTRMRTDAWSGDMEDAVWIELGADDGFSPTPRPAPLKASDWEQIAKANPSYPHRTPAESVERLRRKLSPESFFREGVGVWDAATRITLFDPADWEAGRRESRPDGLAVKSLALAVSIDLAHSSIVAGSEDPDGGIWVKPLHHGPGTKGVVDRCVKLQESFGVDVVIDGRGPGAVLIPHLEAAGVKLQIATTGNVLDAFATLETNVRDRQFFHITAPELDIAVIGAVKRPVGDRAALGRRKAEVDISPIEAACLAGWRAGLQDEPDFISKYETEGLLVL